LTAAGLRDLYELGMADFLRAPFCIHEARIRLERLLDRQRRPAAAVPSTLADSGGAAQYAPALPSIDAVCDTILNQTGSDLEAYAEAAALRFASSRESFREAKSKVI